MNNTNKKIIFFSLILFLSAITLSGCSNQTKSSSKNLNNVGQANLEIKQVKASGNNEYPMSSVEQVADKLQIYYFHRTQRCSTCLSIGRYTGELVKQKFAAELESGQIEFREVNVELPENRDLANKFQASGPSLYINAIKNNQDNINQDMTIWRLIGNEDQFKNYLENKINTLLGK